jgi:hypothetical protein
MGLNLIELEAVRTEMLGEIEDDLAAGKLYLSDRFTDEGSAAYPGHLKAAVETRNRCVADLVDLDRVVLEDARGAEPRREDHCREGSAHSPRDVWRR